MQLGDAEGAAGDAQLLSVLGAAPSGRPRPAHTAVAVPCEAGQPPPPPSAATGDSPPPSYHQATDQPAPPPSYESVVGGIIKAKRGSASGCQRLLQTLNTFLTSILDLMDVFYYLVINLVLPATMVLMGVLHMEHCPVQPGLGWWLAIAGLLPMYRSIPACVYAGMNSVGPPSRSRPRHYADRSGSWAVVLLFNMLHMGVGFYLVLSVLPPNYSEPTSTGYCHFSLYMTAVVALLVTAAVTLFCAYVVILWFFCGWQPPASGAGFWPPAETMETAPATEAATETATETSAAAAGR